MNKAFEKKLFWILLAVILISGFLHFRNLHDVVYLDSDEARAYTILSTGPLIHLICKPFFSFYPQESTAFYVAAAIGFINILIFWLICSITFDQLTTFFSVIIYAWYPMRINYSRMLYPAVFVDFFLLLLLLCICLWLKRRNHLIAIPAGICAAALIFVHPFTLWILLGIGLALMIFWFHKRNEVSGQFVCYSLLYGLFGFMVFYWGMERYLMKIKEGYVFTDKLLLITKRSIDVVKEGGNNVHWFLITLFQEFTVSLRTIFRALVTIISLSVVSAAAWRKKEPIVYLIIAGFLGTGIFVLTALLGFNNINYRHFIWIVPILSVALAWLLVSMNKSNRRLFVWMGIVCFVIFCATSLFESYMVTVETFNIDEIEDWLEAHNIKKPDLLTFLHFYTPGDRVSVYRPPVRQRKDSVFTAQSYEIVWPLVYNGYKKGMFHYIIPSGPGVHVHLERDDPLLKYVTPLHSWVHPYSKYKYRFFGRKINKSEPLMINLYRLEDVFSLKTYINFIKGSAS